VAGLEQAARVKKAKQRRLSPTEKAKLASTSYNNIHFHVVLEHIQSTAPGLTFVRRHRLLPWEKQASFHWFGVVH
jgi:hypothetical protein